MKHKVTVLVTGIGGGGLGEQLIKAFRLSDKVNYTIVGTDAVVISKGFADVDISAVVPFANAPKYIDVLIELCKRFQVQALFPGSEPELKVISENREQFEQNGIFLPINPKNVIDTCFDKAKTIDFLKNNEFIILSHKK